MYIYPQLLHNIQSNWCGINLERSLKSRLCFVIHWCFREDLADSESGSDDSRHRGKRRETSSDGCRHSRIWRCPRYQHQVSIHFSWLHFIIYINNYSRRLDRDSLDHTLIKSAYNWCQKHYTITVITQPEGWCLIRLPSEVAG